INSIFDNSAKNRFNPDPSKSVRWGDPTYDEMLLGYIDYIADRKPVPGMDAKAFDAFTGKYNAGFLNITIVRKGDRLFSEIKDQPTVELFPEAQDQFFVREIEGLVTFNRNEKGEVSGAVFDFGGRKITAKKKIETTAGSGQ